LKFSSFKSIHLSFGVIYYNIFKRFVKYFRGGFSVFIRVLRRLSDARVDLVRIM